MPAIGAAVSTGAPRGARGISAGRLGTAIARWRGHQPAGQGRINPTVIDIHKGIRFEVAALPRGELFEGRFTILDRPLQGSGMDDSYRPTTDNAWATQTEALTYATEAAHHAIEGIAPFIERGRGDD